MQLCVKELEGTLPVDELVEFGMNKLAKLREEEGDDLLPWAILFVPTPLTHKMYLRCSVSVPCLRGEQRERYGVSCLCSH